MKRNRMIVMIISVMLVSMQFNIVSFAEDNIDYINCYGQKLLFRSDYNITSKTMLIRHMARFNFTDIPSGYNYTKSDLLVAVDKILQESDINYSDYPYYYVGVVFTDANNFQLILRCTKQSDLFCSLCEWNDPDTEFVRYFSPYQGSSGTSDDLQDYAVLNYSSGVSTISNYNDGLYGYRDYAMFFNQGVYLLCSNMNLYSCSEYKIIDGGSLAIDNASNLRSCYLDNYKSNLTLLNNDFDINYGGAPLDSSSEGSNNALSQFTMCGVVDNRYYSNYGLNINYAMSDLSYNTYKAGKLVVDYTISLRLVEENSNKVYPVMSLSSTQKYSLTGQSGYINVDLFNLIKDCIGKYDSLEEYAMYNKITTALNGSSIDGVNVSISETFKNNLLNDIVTRVGFSDVVDSITYTSSDIFYTFVFDTFTVSAKAYVSNGSSSTNRRSSSVNLVKGANNSYNYTGIDVDNLLPDTSDVIDNTNYYVYNSDDNSYKYYNSVSNEYKNVGSEPYVSLGDIVINVDVNGGGSSGSMIQNNNVSFPDNIIITIKGFLSGDDAKVTIEDDDLTDNSLREDLADGFGLIDDASTPEAGDGYITLLNDTYSGIDPDFKDLIMFGISTTVGIAILRMIFKR